MTPTSHRLLNPDAYRVMPWKNGGGTTSELIIEPEGADLESGFHWRLSMAEVGVSGPFSRFEGYDRTLLLLEGRGMWLEMAGQGAVELKHAFEPVRFSGDWTTTGTLLDGPCRDFNVITRRDRCHHHLEIHRLAGSPATLQSADVHFLFCAAGSARVDALGLTLAPLQLLRVEGTPALGRVTGEAILLAIGIHLQPAD